MFDEYVCVCECVYVWRVFARVCVCVCSQIKYTQTTKQEPVTSSISNSGNKPAEWLSALHGIILLEVNYDARFANWIDIYCYIYFRFCYAATFFLSLSFLLVCVLRMCVCVCVFADCRIANCNENWNEKEAERVEREKKRRTLNSLTGLFDVCVCVLYIFARRIHNLMFHHHRVFVSLSICFFSFPCVFLIIFFFSLFHASFNVTEN